MCPRRRTIERHGSTSTPSLRFNITARNAAIGARIAEQRLAADAVRDLPDGLHVGNTAPVPVTTRDAGHFLREDKGVEVATAIVAFIRSTDQSRAA